MKRIIYALMGLSVFGFALLFAAPQQAPLPAPREQSVPADAQMPVFTADPAEVIVPVTVTDEQGRFVSNLTQKDFRVLDEGKPQRIKHFSHDAEKQPIVIGFLVDLGSRSKVQWDKYKETIKELIWALVPGNKLYAGYLISYSLEAELAMNTTFDGDKIAEQVDRMKPGAGAALSDAIYLACTRRDLVKGEPYQPRRIIVIIGDGTDTSETHSVAEVLELAKRNQVTIYGISTVAFGFASSEQGVLERLANETGGKVEYPLNNPYRNVAGYLSVPRDAGNYVYEPGTGGYAAAIAKGIVDAVAAIQGEVTTQYVLTYVPDTDAEDAEKSFRRIKVEIPTLPPTITIRAKDGYYPNRPR